MKVKLSKQNAEYCAKSVGSIVDIADDDYIIGVVAAQIGDAPIEACKAQAVAARTFAYPWSSKDKAISDSSDAQVFNMKRLDSAELSYPNVVKAVKETCGQMLSYQGSIISTCSYCDSNGGRTVSSKQRWGGQCAWLVSKDDPWDLKVSNGKRNGHGVGMSQKGAVYAASIGKTYREILSFYYQKTEIVREGVGKVAKTVDSASFVSAAQQLYSKYQSKGMIVYANGKSGQYDTGRYLCDCRGYIIWTLRTLGINIASIGTNWMIRNQMSQVRKVSKAEQLEVGQAVFKAYEKSNPKWNLPTRYRLGQPDYKSKFGELDIYHVGIVTQTSPSLVIRHCTAGGIKTDTKLGAWCWAGTVEWVKIIGSLVEEKKQDQPSIQTSSIGTVTVNKLNFRKSPKTSAYRLAYLNAGDKVEILADCDVVGWYHIKSGNVTGYVMAQYIKRG